ncbi:MAG: TPM domain-containing protein, partial [Bacteroidales bacterium]
HQWGVGQKKFDNGIVFLVKEKTADSKGEVYIAIGYGLEGVIPDAIANRIIDNEVLPAFRQGNYFEGIDNALTIMMQLSLGEFTAKEYAERSSGESPVGVFFGLAIAFFVITGIFGRAGRIRKNSIGRSLPFWLLLSMLGSGSRHSGSWRNFSSGSGSFGGGGGFGGFGGGGFGGGGAGGSW